MNWKLTAITTALGAVAIAALVGGGLALFAHSASGVAAAGEWFGGAATGAAFFWGVYLFQETQRVRAADLRAAELTESARQLQRARLVRISEAAEQLTYNKGPTDDQSPPRMSPYAVITNYTDVDIFDVRVTVTVDQGTETGYLRRMTSGDAQRTHFSFPGKDVVLRKDCVTILYGFPDGTLWRRQGDNDPTRVTPSMPSRPQPTG